MLTSSRPMLFIVIVIAFIVIFINLPNMLLLHKVIIGVRAMNYALIS